MKTVTEGSVVLKEGLFSVFPKLYSWGKKSKRNSPKEKSSTFLSKTNLQEKLEEELFKNVLKLLLFLPLKVQVCLRPRLDRRLLFNRRERM